MPPSLRKEPKKPVSPFRKSFSLKRDVGAVYRFLRRKLYMTFRKDYVKKQLETRKGICGGHGCCDLSFFHRKRKCLDPCDRTKCLKWEDLPYECIVYPFDEKDKVPETRPYCNFYWEEKKNVKK